MGKESDLQPKCVGISINSSDQLTQVYQPTFISMSENSSISDNSSMTEKEDMEKGDIEVYPVVEIFSDTGNDLQNETIIGKSLKVLSRTRSSASRKDPGPPPDGGISAWTQVLIGHLVIMNTW